MRLHDKVVLITGAASGIGLAAAQECAEEGANLVLADLPSAPGLASLATLGEASRPTFVVPTDVTRLADCQALVAVVEERHGRVDAVIHAAGILQGAFQPVDELDPDIFRRVIDVNLVGTFHVVKALLPLMKRAGRGTLVLITSGAGQTAGGSSAAYSASKGGAHGFILHLREQLTRAGIRLNEVCPGSVNTPLKRQNVIDAARAHGQPEEQALAQAKLVDPRGVAKVLAFLASDDAAYVTGAVFTR